MKNVMRLLILAAAVASFTLPVFAQDAPSGGAASVCTTEADAKAALYKTFLETYKGNPEQQRAASETAKQYMSKYGSCPDEADKKIATFIQNWNTKYEKAVRDFACTSAFDKNDYAKAFQACQAILSEQPDNIDTVFMLARAGYLNVNSATPNKALNTDAARMTRRAIELIESGKAPAKWEPFQNRDEAVGFLYYELGLLTQETSPTDASAAFIKAAQSNSTFKRTPSTFTYLANIYEANDLKKLVGEYAAAFPPNVPIPDDKKPQYDQMLAQIGKVQDRIVDAYARAIAVMNSDPKYASDPKLAAYKKDVMTKLTAYYKQRHENAPDTEIQELVNNVLSRPIPIAGQEPAMPAPASSSGMNGTTPVGQPVSNVATPAATTTPKPAPAATTPAKPATMTPATPASTTPKPKPVSKKSAPAKPVARKTTSGR